MPHWQNYPENYRQLEVTKILSAILSGESVSLVGLSGSGKSNLLGFISNRVHISVKFVLIDGNRLQQKDNEGFLKLILSSIPNYDPDSGQYHLEQIMNLIKNTLSNEGQSICLLIDRMDILDESEIRLIGANLRSIRDHFKYQLSYVIATRNPIPIDNEISELVVGNTIWLGPLSRSDAIWSIESYAKRKNKVFSKSDTEKIIELSGKYPSFLRGLCEAFANELNHNTPNLLLSAPLQMRIQEFLRDKPSKEALEKSGLLDLPILSSLNENKPILTDKENKLLTCFESNPNVILDKDTIIRSVWPEDKVFEKGIRDDSLTQLIRRLRKKIEADPGIKATIETVPGRGYIFHR